MKFFLSFLFILFGAAAFAQKDSANVVIHKDPRVDELVKKQAAANAAIKKSSLRSMKGYRILVINTNKRDEAIDAKTKVYKFFPDQKSYLIYQSPFFKLKVGNFKTRDEAEEYRKTMTSIFPKGVFIIPDVIEIRPGEED